MSESNLDKKTVLIAPLNWGLGHATRMVPTIKKYRQDGWTVYIASDGDALLWLQKEFPDFLIFDVGVKTLRYAQSGCFLLHLKQLLPTFLNNIKQEHLWLEQFVKQHPVDLIISDNRYGFWHANIKSIFVSHQFNLPVPWYLFWSKFIAQYWLRKQIEQFTKIWILDDANHQLAGRLSHLKLYTKPHQFIGLQSRFNIQKQAIQYDYLLLASGLAPHKQHLIDTFYSIVKTKKHLRIAIVGGKPQNFDETSQIKCFNILNTADLNYLLSLSETIVARSGYSTIMDLIRLDKKAILIPTPGQPEQEYLADHHKTKKSWLILKHIGHLMDFL
ncbi:MAG: hypothetical protein JXR60_10130 [Bacteroidales bacterium]|nr:hypothetical protein [Bacteroidales bacterium]